MKHHCKNHPNKIALSLCHSCGEYYCSDCLNEGLEYYYCKNEKCNKLFLSEIAKNKNFNTKANSLSKESKFIKRVATAFIVLLSLVFIKVTINLLGVISLGLFFTSAFDTNINILGHYLFKYMSVFLVIGWIILALSLYASINLYRLKKRKLFLYSLFLQMFLIIIYNIFIYSYFEYMLKTSLALMKYEQYKNFWSLDKHFIAIISVIIIVFQIYLIKKFSSKKIINQFSVSNA